MSDFKTVQYGKKSERRNYSKIRSDVPIPNLVEIQTSSFDWFDKVGLSQLLKDISPIKSFDGNLKIYFESHRFEEPKYDIIESKLRDINYSRPLKVKVRLEKGQTGEITEKEIFMGDIPYMTPVGTFIINGAERVVVSQIVRSSGIYYSKKTDKNKSSDEYVGQIIPTRGAWINYQNSKGVFYVELDRSRKIPLTLFLRALGYNSNEEIQELFGNTVDFTNTFEAERDKIIETISKPYRNDARVENKERLKKEVGHINSATAAITIYCEIRDEMHENLRLAFTGPTDENSKQIIEKAHNDALGLINERLFNHKRYDLQKVGRYKYNLKLDVLERADGLTLAKDIIANEDIFDDESGELLYEKGTVILKKNQVVEGDVLDKIKKARGIIRKKMDILDVDGKNLYYEVIEVFSPQTNSNEIIRLIGNDSRETKLTITPSDIVASLSYYFNLCSDSRIGTVDDIDHLANRRLRLIGELLENQFRIGFGKLEKNIVERMSKADVNDTAPESLINIKPLTSTLKEFFCSSQLSQFMDQINPLAEITQKRRISALGTGGIARDRAGAEMRDVHNSHYGRMCPIETPEGPSIGLITSLAIYARVNEYGFIETPYFKVETVNGKKRVSDEVVYLSAFQEQHEQTTVIASASTPLDENGYFKDTKVIGRCNGETEIVSPDDVDYMDVSPKQIVSVAAACVPFLEHNDGTRALMGANMQRQAVPIINPESPIVGTGIEHRAAKDSGSALICEGNGIVEYVDAKRIEVKEESGKIKKYNLYQFIRSNSATSIMQRPIVKVGEVVEKGDIIADGQSMQNGELALGRNVRVAFMTWDGYNYEDAVIMSERMVQDDVYTSIHIEEYEIEMRDTKLGVEEFTTEIPNVNEQMIKNLDKHGIIIPGSEVKEGDILVGKVTPKGISDVSPEEKLLFAIFGDKAREVRDTSLRVPHGGGGIVQSIQHFKKSNGDDLAPGVNEVVRVYIVQKRKIKIGDKMAGRHGNKGVISNILPIEDMPYTKDGEPIDIILNPQGVPSRMNIGQVLEMHLGMAAKKLGIKVATPVFDGATIEDIENIMKEAKMPSDGKEVLYDGRSGEPFENRVNVGIMYFVKLSHMVDDKLHARSVGPYTLVTQQPMGGKAQNGGQRFGEMEVWALEAYGASHTLQEMLTVKSDDILGRNQVFRAITDGKEIPAPSIPESFRVLTRELQALGIKVELINEDGVNEVNKSIVDFNETIDLY